MASCNIQRYVQEALKAIPDHVLDAPPPELDALPAFSLPQPLPPPHSTSAHAGTDVSSPSAALLPESSADAGDASGEQSRELQQVALLGTSEAIADVREAAAAPRQAEQAAAGWAPASGEEQIAEPKRLRLDSSTAGDARGTGAAEDQSGIALEDHQHVKGQSSLEQGLKQAQEGDVDAGSALDHHSEQEGKHRPFLEKGRVLVSA